MGKGKGSKNKSAKDKKSGSHQSSAQFDWGTVLNNGPIRLDQITMRDNQKKTIWQVIAEKNHSWSENLEALSESLQIKSVILSRINELLPEQKINALGHAIKADHVQAASTLLRLGADIRCAFADAPWLHALLHHCQEASDIISLLEQCEKQELVIDATLQCQVDQHNRSLHHYALVQHNSEQLVQWLLDHCLYAHHPIQNNPILLWLITHKKNHLLNRYIERSPASQVYAYDQKGKNCLFHACQVGDLELVRTLLWHHSNIHTCNPKGENALHILAKVSEFKHVHQNILRLLIISGMDITKIDHNGDSPLMIALRHKQAEMIPTILLISDLYQINHRGEHCLSLALCSGMFDIAQVIISRHRKTPNQPFDMEQRAIQLPKAYVDQCQSQYFSIHGQQLTIDMTQKASPLSLVILGNCLFDMSCMRVLTELLDRQLEAIDHEDDPYYFAMATQNPGMVHVLMKSGIPVKNNRIIQRFLTSSQGLNRIDPHQDYSQQVNQLLSQNANKQALEKACMINLNLFSPHWGALPTFQDHFLLMCLEESCHDLAFENLYRLMRTYNMSGCTVLDQLRCDPDTNPVGLTFADGLQSLFLRCEQVKIHARCSEDSKARLRSLGYVLSADEKPKLLQLSNICAKELPALIPANSLVVKDSKSYREAATYWHNVLLNTLQDDIEAEKEWGELSLMALFIKRLENTAIEKTLRENLTQPPFIFNALILIHRSPDASIRTRAMRILNHQVSLNQVKYQQSRVLNSLAWMLPAIASNIAYGYHADYYIQEVGQRQLSADEVMRIAGLLFMSMRRDQLPTEASQTFFSYCMGMIIAPCEFLDGVNLLKLWMLDCPERNEWFSASVNRVRFLGYLKLRDADGDDRETILATLDRVLHYYDENSIETILSELKDYKNLKYTQAHEILVFLCEPQVIACVEKKCPNLAARLQSYRNFAIISASRSAKMHANDALSIAQESQQSSQKEHINELELLQQRLQQRCDQLESKNSKILSDLEQSAEENVTLERNLKAAEQARDEVQTKYDELWVNHQALTTSSGQVQHENFGLREALDVLRHENQLNQETLMDTHQQQVKKISAARDKAVQSDKTSKQQLRQLQAQLKEATANLKESQKIIRQHNEDQHEKIKQINSLTQSITQIECAHQSTQQELSALKTTYDELLERNQKQLQQQQTIEEALKTTSAARDQLSKELKEKQSELKQEQCKNQSVLLTTTPTERTATRPQQTKISVRGGDSPVNINIATGPSHPSFYPSTISGTLAAQAMFANGSTMALAPPQVIQLSTIVPPLLQSLLQFTTEIASVLCPYQADEKTRVALGGSLALLLARQQNMVLGHWLQTAIAQHEDVDLDLYTAIDLASISAILLQAWPEMMVQSVGGRSAQRLHLFHPSIGIRIDLHINPRRKAYPDAITWAWDTGCGDWYLHLGRLAPQQKQFLSTDQSFDYSISSADHNYSFFWGLCQLIMHTYYQQPIRVCQERVRCHVPNVDNQSMLARDVSAILQRYDETPMWPIAVEIIARFVIMTDQSGYILTPLDYLLPKGHNSMFEPIHTGAIWSCAQLKQHIRELYKKNKNLTTLVDHQGPFDWRLGEEKDPEFTSTQNRKQYR